MQSAPHRKVQVVLLSPSEGGHEKVLLLKTCGERGEFWQNVTGSLEDGESPKDGAMRELQEETGLGHEDLSGPLLPLHKTFKFRDRFGRNVVETCWLAMSKITCPKIHLGKEHDEYLWESPLKASSQYKYPSNIEALELAMTRV